jgi:hypothetical protein
MASALAGSLAGIKLDQVEPGLGAVGLAKVLTHSVGPRRGGQITSSKGLGRSITPGFPLRRGWSTARSTMCHRDRQVPIRGRLDWCLTVASR